jgi:hypothetical protein
MHVVQINFINICNRTHYIELYMQEYLCSEVKWRLKSMLVEFTRSDERKI